MAVEYGTIAVVPMGEWNAATQYDTLNLVTRDGSSYVAHTKPPVGTSPTETTYWQVSAQGASKATAVTPGVVKPDGASTEVNAEGEISAKLAGQDTPGIVKGSAGIAVGEGGSIDVKTAFEQAAELANIIPDEPIAQVLGKVSKAIAVTMGLNQNALLKNMLTNMDANDVSKVPTAALVHSLYERIGMGTQLEAGHDLTGVVNQLNNDLTLKYCDNLDALLPDGTYYTGDSTAGIFPPGLHKNGIFKTCKRLTGYYVKYTDAYGRQADRTYNNGWRDWDVKVSNVRLNDTIKELDLNSFFDFFIGSVTTPLNSPIDGVIYLINIPGNVTGRAYQQVMSVGNTKVTMMYRNSFGGTWRDWESSSSDLDIGTYTVAVLFQSAAVGSIYRAYYNFCLPKSYDITINTARITGSGVNIKGLINISASDKYVLFHGTDPSLAGKVAEINITVK